MSIFVVFRVTKPQILAPIVEAEFPGNFLKVDEDEWLISAQLTAQEVSERLKIPGGENGSAIIFKMSNYFGRAPSDVWDWIKTKSEEDN
ncbi:hypothetical protein [Rhizobium leguminosarum]|uniref:hypothetical protein n=1 Tax=Rhizobium leguminosarum TaxID=384 RepID=UPI003F9C1114